MAMEMRCRYDPEHGTFSGPTSLRKHYDREHADVYRQSAATRVRHRCRICGKTILVVHSHIKLHPEATARPVSQYFDVVGDDETDVESASTDLARLLESHGGDPRHPWDVDDLVVPIVTALSLPSGMVPVDHLAAIFAWRDATSAMLAAVTRSTVR